MREAFVAGAEWQEARAPRGEPVAEPIGWCQPMDQGKHATRKFLVTFEDSELGTAVFNDEAEARDHWTKANAGGWNCYLFGALPLLPTSYTHPAAGMPELVEADEDEAAAQALAFAKPKLIALKNEKGLVGVWCQAFRAGWTSAKRALREP